MNSPRIAPKVDRIRQRDLIGMPHWVARGVWELMRARVAVARIKPRDIARLNAAPRAEERDRRNRAGHPDAIERIAFIVPLIARYLPWRCDCLVQALAAQRWLALHGFAGEIRIGIDRPAAGKFDAHAWLVYQDRVLTGGRIERYSVLLGPSEHPPGDDRPGTNALRKPGRENSGLAK